VENNRMQTLPERSQRDHWKFLYKNMNKETKYYEYVYTVQTAPLSDAAPCGFLIGVKIT
jgi:hypothetical protein